MISSAQNLYAKKFIDEYGITPNEAAILGWLEELYGDELLSIGWSGDPYIGFKSENGYVISITINKRRNFTDFQWLEKFLHLRRLNINESGITNLEIFQNLTQLEELILCYNEITEIKGLDNLKKLKMLDLYGNKITEIKGIEKLPNLKDITLNENKISKEKLIAFYEQFYNVKYDDRGLAIRKK